jgi:2-methylcitrate dehydratase PrpD
LSTTRDGQRAPVATGGWRRDNGAGARPASGYHAAFSGPYTVAAALLGGGLGVSHEDFTAAARDPRRLALAALVRCVEDLTALLTSAGER